MKSLPVLIVLILLKSFAFSQTPKEIDSLTIYEETVNGHKFLFTIVRCAFDPARHGLSQLNDGKIDGEKYYGTDGDTPKTEIKYFTLSIDKEEIYIDSKFYKNFYNPNIGDVNGDKSVGAFFGNDYKSVFVLMNGSDAAGSYEIIWVFRKNGKHIYMIPAYDEIYFNFN